MVRTRAALHRALLVLAERMPFADITVRAIAEQAGIGYATFFRHYPDKQSLLAAIAETAAPKTDAAYRAFCAALDKGAKHGIIAKNTAVRKKARAAAMLRKTPAK